jgi:tRNA threonylcarbamoyladenosine biosynthesis protein TsaB
VSYILNIDTAIETCSICLSLNGEGIGLLQNPAQKEAAAWIQPSIKILLEEHGVSLKQLAAVAVSNGPGSYTGLRVGMATAKGLCFVLNIPLIAISTLKMMVIAALNEEADLFCPMIDARRMEVFTAIYDRALTEVVPAQASILTPDTFTNFIKHNRIIFFGNGSVKFQKLVQHPNALFTPKAPNAKHLAPLSYESLKLKSLADVAYCEPDYGKDFFSFPAKSLL